MDLRVSDLLTDDLQWNKRRIEEILPEFTTQIQNIKPNQQGAEDSCIWQPLPSGSYSTKSGYNSMFTHKSRGSDCSEASIAFSWRKDIWSASCSPKLKYFLWAISQKALPLAENLHRRGVALDLCCPRCGEEETAVHTFFLCPFAKDVWSKIPLKNAVHLAAEDDFTTILVKFRSTICLPPMGVTETVLPWVCWSIWKDRNTLIFEKRSLKSEEIATKSLSLAREWKQAQRNDSKKQRKHIVPPSTRQGMNHQVDTDLITCKTDASWDSKGRKAGLAWVFSGLEKPKPNQGSLVQEFVKSPLIAEALALRSGVRMAATMGISKIRFQSDNSTLIAVINNKTRRKELVGIISDIHDLSYRFESIAFSHISRRNNEKADALAKSVLRNTVV